VTNARVLDGLPLGRLVPNSRLWTTLWVVSAVPAQIEHLKLCGGSTADTTHTRYRAVDVLRLSVLTSTARPRGTGPRFRPRFASACSPDILLRVRRMLPPEDPGSSGWVLPVLAAAAGPWGPHLGSLPFLSLLRCVSEQFSIGHVAGTKIVSAHNDRRGRAGHVSEVTRSCVGIGTLRADSSCYRFSMYGSYPASSSELRFGGHAGFRA
jgi:hypothetical protein